MHGPGNLWHPGDEEPGEDHGAHGDFDNRSHQRSAQLWVAQHAVSAAEVVGTVASAASAAVTRAKDAVRR